MRLTTAPKIKMSIRSVGVVIAICSWIAVSNHCAFAAVATENAKAQSECPFHSKPAKQKQPSSHLQCCKTLHAIVVVQSKAWERDHAKFRDATFPFQLESMLAYSMQAVAPLLLDTGPPLHAFSFAELILQRSLLAHAPPLLA
jgi:hypothetical protein